MDGLEISYRLRRLGANHAAIARQLGVSASVVGNVINDRITSFEVATHVASLLGMSPLELWPQRYSFKPRGRSPRRRANPSNDKEVAVS